ncbi:MAG: N-acetylmuramic acid 6-phosphate etherase, partial [Myxococcales bacterium]|nr:N-acetylmuramic acid 6-phosphate etherase [Myxococcales bacterium]
ALASGGRLIYIGSGTTGRLCFLDPAECPPTFGVSPSRVVSVLAGGPRAMARAVEGAEDSASGGRDALRALDLARDDLVCGISASGTTPFVRGALRYAARRRVPSALVTCGPAPAVEGAADILVRLDVGPEVVSGSTRMKAGLATKAVLHTVSTAAMIRLGKVYDNLMVDVLPTNKKLRLRAEGIVRTLTGLSQREAAHYLRKAKDRPKVAVVMALHDVSERRARALLDEHGGHLRPLIEQAP